MNINWRIFSWSVLIGCFLVSCPSDSALAASILTASVGGPYQTVEGAQVKLTGTVSGGSGSYSLSWDVNNDGTVDYRGATGYFLSKDNGVYYPVFIARDTRTGVVKRVSATVKITNLAPTVTLQSPLSAMVNNPVAFSAKASDYGAVDAASNFTFKWNFGDGVTLTTVSKASGTASHTYSKAGGFTVSVVAVDKDGVSSQL